jgi:Putative beta barrel porin-7 (BBP7)
MRKRVLGTIAALTMGAGAAFAQSPRPASPAQAYGGGLLPAGGPAVGEIVPSPPLGGYGPEMGGMPMGDPGMMAPGYPMGYHGQPGWQDAMAQPGAQPPATHWYLNSKFLLWFVKAQPTNVPYLSTSAPQDSGLAGRPTTTLLHSRSDLGYNLFSGFQINGGWYRGADRRYGLDFGGMMFERKSNVFFAQSDTNGIPVIARPFVDASTGGPAVLTVAQQGLASGAALVSTSNEMFGAEANLLANLYRSCPEDACKWTIDGLFGFRYFELHEDLQIRTQSTILGGGSPRFNGAAIFNPAIVSVTDIFDVYNRFYGGQIGTRATVDCGEWSFGFSSKLAFGVMNQVLDVNGRSDLLDLSRSLSASSVGGLYANALNVGRYRNDEFAVIPEFGLSIGRNWSSWLTTGIGYNYLYINRVSRPGNAVTNVVNPAIIPTSQSFGAGAVVPVPNRVLAQDEFWAQGVTFQMIVKY